jgi:hypothetical protein
MANKRCKNRTRPPKYPAKKHRWLKQLATHIANALGKALGNTLGEAIVRILIALILSLYCGHAW